jgi:hypothetical protein
VRDYIADIRVVCVGTLLDCLQKYREASKHKGIGWESEYEVLVEEKRDLAITFLGRIC